MKKCNVCLKNRRSAVSIQKSDKSNVNWFTKLQYVIPELEWLKEYVICENCTKQLEKAWEFKKFVLNCEKDRRDAISIGRISVDDTDEYNTKNVVIKNEIYCEICLKTFTTTTQLHQHKLQIHSKEIFEKSKSQNVFVCYNCDNSFDIKENLISHIENDHKRAKLCSVSSESLIDENILQNIVEDCDDWEKLADEDDLVDLNKADHEKLLNETNSETKLDHQFDEKLRQQLCQDCGINFSSVEELNLHNSSKHSEQTVDVEQKATVKKRRGRKSSRKFNCEICNEEFSYLKLVLEHCMSVHSMDKKTIKPYSCEKCEMRFVSSANLDQHRHYHDKNRTHICSLCGKSFMTKSDLTVHEYTHYNRRNYKCSLCDKAFNTNKNLRTHNLVVHTDRKLWKYGCSICEKRFPLKTNYDQHLRRHTGEKDYPCHICKKPFISKSELQRHVHVHSNIRAFKCSNCDREYKERRTYQVHLAKKHGIGNVKITVREKRFVCHICPSQFYDKQKLMRHICSHSGLKPFPCYMCDKKFTDKSYLKHHLKTAHNITEHFKIEGIQ